MGGGENEAGGLKSIRDDSSWSVAPEAFDIVIIAHTGLENMHDDVDEVQKHPLQILHSFASPYAGTLLPAAVVNGVCNGFDLRIRFAGTHDKIIGDVGQAGQIEDDDILCLLREREFRGELCEFLCFQCASISVIEYSEPMIVYSDGFSFS